MKHVLLLAFVCSLFCGFGQSKIAVGDWKDHISYQRIVSLAKNGNTVYAASELGILTYNLSSGELSPIGRVQGLSDSKISIIDFDESTQTLVVAYQNGNIDLIKGQQILNVPDILKKDLIGSSNINEITIVEGGIAYLSTDFGIVKLNLANGFVLDSYLFTSDELSLSVQDMAIYKDSIFAATNQGIYSAPLNTPSILADFTRWRKDNSIPFANETFNQIEVFNNRLFANYFSNQYPNDSLFYRDESANWTRLENAFFYQGNKLRVEDNKLLLVARFSTMVYDQDLNREKTISPAMEIYNEFMDCLLAGERSVIAFTNSGLVIEDKGQAEPVDYNNPFYNIGFRLNVGPNDDLYATAGGFNAQYSKLFSNRGFYRYRNGTWENFIHQFREDISDTLNDFVSVTPISSSSFYVNTWGDGLMYFDNDRLQTVYFNTNSPLRELVAFNSQIYTGFSQRASNGNLWVANGYTDFLFKVLKPDGSWIPVDLGQAYGPKESANVTDFIISSSGDLWITNGGKGCYVFRPDEDLSNAAGHQGKQLTSSENSGALPDNQILDIAEDLDGDIWVGSSKGPAVFYNPDFIFEDNSERAQQIFIEQDGNVQIVLETEQINAIAIDGGNRKWFGTQSSGVFVFSEDVTEQVAHFTVENSPLLSNQILDLAILPKSGEVFISTALGIQSYRSDATRGAETATDLNVFPNPVHPSYSGNVTIDGFVRDSRIKITTVDGLLINELRSQGGRATWNVRDFNGAEVASGVYLILASNEDGSEKIAGRVMVIRN